jgi:hypothetical protein
MMVVLEIATIAPANTLASVLQPNDCAVRYPRYIITLLCTMAVRPAVGATSTSLRMLNSRPSENISRMTPSSDSA